MVGSPAWARPTGLQGLLVPHQPADSEKMRTELILLIVPEDMGVQPAGMPEVTCHGRC